MIPFLNTLPLYDYQAAAIIEQRVTEHYQSEFHPSQLPCRVAPYVVLPPRITSIEPEKAA